MGEKIERKIEGEIETGTEKIYGYENGIKGRKILKPSLPLSPSLFCLYPCPRHCTCFSLCSRIPFFEGKQVGNYLGHSFNPATLLQSWNRVTSLPFFLSENLLFVCFQVFVYLFLKVCCMFSFYCWFYLFLLVLPSSWFSSL